MGLERAGNLLVVCELFAEIVDEVPYSKKIVHDEHWVEGYMARRIIEARSELGGLLTPQRPAGVAV